MSDKPETQEQTRRQRIIIVLTAIGVVAVLALTVTFMGGAQSQPQMAGEQGTTENTGDAAALSANETVPTKTLQRVNGTNVSLDNFRGEPVLLWMPATTCSTCQQGARKMAANASRFTNLTIVVATNGQGSDSWSTAGTVEFARTYAPNTLNSSQWTWTTAPPETWQAYNPQSTHGLFYVISPDGTVVARGTQPSQISGMIATWANRTVESQPR